MEKTIKVILLTNSERLISEIEEVGADIGQPDCKLINPFTVRIDNNQILLAPWLLTVTNQDTIMMSSDKILTLADPKPTILEKYEELTK